MEPVTDHSHTATAQPSSLYHTCRSVLDGLAAVPGLEQYLSAPSSTSDQHSDPLSKLWSICRQGSSLCILFNTLRADIPIKLQQDDGKPVKPKACVYHFIIACRDHLKLPEERRFTVTDLYQDDTNGFVKVVNTVNHLLELLEDGGMILIQRSSPHPRHSDAPKSTRDKVVSELLETERKYVHDLEVLQHCMREAQTQQVLSPDTLHRLFGNLNALVNFQRWFLVFSEDNADRPPEEQRFGQLFLQQEDAFSVYEPFCANFQTAQCLVVQEASKLQKLTEISNPVYELPSLLIKPVQRVCKYPLLVQELLKATPDDWPYYEETSQGLEAIQRVAAKINETKRRQENQQLAEDLKRRVIDNRHHCDISGCGQLLLHERSVLHRNEVDHDVLLYLFDKALLICMEEKEPGKKSNSKASKKKNKTGKDGHGGGGLVIKGQINMSQIAQVSDITQDGQQHALKVFWSERDPRSHSFTITHCIVRFRNEELLKQWNAALERLIRIEKRLSRESRAAAEALVRKHQPEMALSAAAYEGAPFAEDIEVAQSPRSVQHSSSDEDDSGMHRRLRSHSQHTVSNQRQQHTRSTGSNSNDARRHQYYAATMPGMTLPPLPRDPSVGEFSPLSYPSSPLTGSFPSTPSVSNRTSTCSAGSSGQHTPQQRSRGHPGEFAGLLAGHMFIEDDDEDDFCRAVTAPFMQARIRSQSSPDISCIEQQQQQQSEYLEQEPLPINSRTLYHVNANSDSAPHASTATDEEDAHDTRPLAIKVKLSYMNGIYVIKMPQRASFQELVDRIHRKIRHSQKHHLTLKYQDEDGDLITINSDEDVQMSFEMRGASNAVNIHVFTPDCL